MSPIRQQRGSASAMLCLSILLALFLMSLGPNANFRALAAGPDNVTTTQPASRPWAAKPPAQWPQLLLRNQITVKGFAQWQGGCGFLMQLPAGQTVAVTNCNQLVQGVNVNDLKESISAWSMSPPNRQNQRVILRQLAIPSEDCEPMNCVMMTVDAMRAFPAEVLIPSATFAVEYLFAA